MKIGIVLSKPPSYSETFFNSKIKGLIANGYHVVLCVQYNAVIYNECPVLIAPKVYKNRVKQALKSTLVLLQLLPHFKRVFRFVSLEKNSGRSKSQILKNIYTNAHLLKSNLDWVHFGFTTLALQSEHVAETLNAKMAVSCRGYDMDVYPLKYPNCYSLIWEKADKIHAISHYMLEKAIEHGMPKTKDHAVITPAVDTVKFSNSYDSNQNTVINITTIARLHWIKGLATTLEALAILKQSNIQFKYTIIGKGAEYEALSFAIHQLKLSDCVILSGDLPQAEVIKRLKHTDVYIQYSETEGFCNAVLEAQAMGCLCVVSDGGALPENIIHQKTGWVVPKHNPKALAQTITDVLQLDTNTKQNIKSAARQRVSDHFKIGISVKRGYNNRY